MKMFSKAIAFFLRDYHLNISYRFAFLSSLINIFVSIAVFYYISKIVGQGFKPYLSGYNGDYFAYVLIGIAFSGFITTSMTAFSTSISHSQAQGTLEAMLVTPTRLSSLVLFSSTWSFVYNLLTVAVYLFFGAVVFGLSLKKINLLSAIITLLLATLVFASLGIFGASFMIVFKRGNPVDWIYGLINNLLGGMFFPVKVLPKWLQPFSSFLPIFYALKAMRLAVLNGYPVTALGRELLILSIMGVLILPLSLWSFKKAVQQAKIDGSLVSY